MVRLGRQLRTEEDLKVRQPLAKLHVASVNASLREALMGYADIVREELNVKEVSFGNDETQLANLSLKADFKKLGPRYGKIMKQLGKAIQEMDQKQISELERNGQYTFAELPESPVVTTEDVEIIPEDVPGWLVANDGNITVALDVTVTDELRNEGMGRELVNRIQNIRKSSDFEITDKVMVEITRNEQTDAAIQTFGSYISAQVLATEINVVDAIEDERGVELDIDGIVVKVLVVKK
jgi:isoleucyl-tRNA synthetase